MSVNAQMDATAAVFSTLIVFMLSPFLLRLAQWYHEQTPNPETFLPCQRETPYNRAMLSVATTGLSGERRRAPILVSACLLGETCRYDGKSVPCDAVIKMAKAHELVPICPEVLGGLSTPRTPCEIQPDGRVFDAAGVDRTAAFEAGARETLRIAKEHGCKTAILKENSPSCGSSHVHDGTFSGVLVPGRGKTAAILEAAGIETFSDDEARTCFR